MAKTISPLYTGIQILQFRVFVHPENNETNFIAKLQVNNSGSVSGALFEILLSANGMRVADANIPSSYIGYQSANWKDRWHNVRCEINLDTHKVRTFVDANGDVYETQIPAASAFSFTPGPITGLTLWGWDYRWGKVYIDNIIGFN